MTHFARRWRGTACLLVCATTAAGAPARVYTNDDLERIRRERGAPAEPPAGAPGTPAAVSREKKGGGGEAREERWRREAERLRERLQPLRDQADDLRGQIDARWRLPGVAPVTDAPLLALRRKLAALEARIRDAEDRLEERARRAGALPGWLR